MSTTKRLRTKDEELAYKRIMTAAGTAILSVTDLELPASLTTDRAGAIVLMVSDDIKRMAKVPL